MSIAAGSADNYNRQYGTTDEVRRTPFGWVGSKAVSQGDFVTIDANGKIDQAVAASNDIADATYVGISGVTLASGVAASSDDAEGAFFVTGDDFLIEMQAVDGSGDPVATATAAVGDRLNVYRLSGGRYCANTAATDKAKIVVVGIGPTYPVGTVGGTYLCKLIEAKTL